jgi:hypothetical protein
MGDSDHVPIDAAQCIEFMRCDGETGLCELFIQVGFSLQKETWRGEWMALSHQSAKPRGQPDLCSCRLTIHE